jgi:multisubunit Na+/H+ antiporter MnhE subunit
MAIARGAGFWFAAWLGCMAFWLVLTDTAKLPELAAGAAVAALAATGTELVRRQRVARIAVRPALVAGAWRVLLGAAPDIVRLTRAAVAQLVHPQPVRGRVVALPFRHGGDDPAANGRRAAAQGLGSLAPNSIVIGVAADDRLLVHQLEPTDHPDHLDPLRLR